MLAYSLLYGRSPTNQELVIASQFLAPQATQQDPIDRWQQYCQVMLSANEFMYIR
jgi:hypothetical protein